jgi:glycosyltransferase involved in cell wall biosynthesis
MTSYGPKLILHVINTLGLSGGAEQQLVTNLDRFSDPAFEHHVAYLYGGDPSISWESEVKVPVTALNGNDERAPLLRSGVRLHRLVRRLRPDLIHCSLLDASLISRLVGRMTGTPVMESLVNISHEPIRTVDSDAVRMWKLGGYKLVDRLTMRKVRGFHALTEEVARSWVDTIGLDRDRITVVPRGVSFDVIKAAALDGSKREELRRQLTGDPDALLILVVGREEAQKGHRYLLDAFARIPPAEVDAHVVMLGRPGSSTAALTTQIEELGLAGRVHRLGVRNDVYRLMAAADLMVFPSLFEGMGVSLIEGMASGLPVIVFERPPMSQIVEHDRTGLVVPDRDVHALAQAIVTLGTDPDRRTGLGKAAAEAIRRDYDVAETSRSIERIYHDILDIGEGRAR